MTKRRKWDAKTKAMIVMQGLKGKQVGEICTEHQLIRMENGNKLKEGVETWKV